MVLETRNTIPSGIYMHVSYNTAYIYVPPGADPPRPPFFCGNVATGPNIGNVIRPNSLNGISDIMWINLGNDDRGCTVTQDMVTHEFGHALGLYHHFDGFSGTGSINDIISPVFWDVLATLYANPPSTTANNLVVRRAGVANPTFAFSP